MSADKASDDEKKRRARRSPRQDRDERRRSRGDESKTQALEQASTALLQKIHEQSASNAGGGSGPAGHTEAPKEDVLDAEFEEVKDSDRKKA